MSLYHLATILQATFCKSPGLVEVLTQETVDDMHSRLDTSGCLEIWDSTSASSRGTLDEWTHRSLNKLSEVLNELCPREEEEVLDPDQW